MSPNKKNLIHLTLAIIIFSMIGPLVKLIHLSPLVIVFGRALFAATFLLIVHIIEKKSLRLLTRDYASMSILSLLVAFDWFASFQSLKLSSVAITYITFSVFPVIVALLEPFLLHEKFSLKNIILAFITCFGVLVMIPKFDLGNNVTQGALWGIASGLIFAFIAIWDRKYVKKYSNTTIVFYQNFGVSLILAPLILAQKTISFEWRDILLLSLLGVICTAIGHSLYVKSLTTIKVQTASIFQNSEDIIGIGLAMVLLGEIPNARILIGGSIILCMVIYVSIQAGKKTQTLVLEKAQTEDNEVEILSTRVMKNI